MTTMRQPTSSTAATREQGFGLLELLIGIGLTLVILTTTMVALNDGVRLSNAAQSISEMRHNGRNGLNLMTRDLIQTGQGIPTGGIPIPSGAGVTPIVRPGPGVLSYVAGTVVLPALTPGPAQGPVVKGRLTDIISLLYADQTLDLDEFPLSAIAADGSTMTVNAATSITDADDGIATGDLILFSNPLGHAVQQVTGVAGQIVTFGATDSMNLNQRAAPAGTIMQLQDAPDSFPMTTARRIWMITYFVDNADPAAPKLMRVVNNGTPRPIALDIEDIQFTFDLVDGYTNPADVESPPVGNSPAQIRKVNVLLATRSHKQNAATGRYQYQTLTTQVALRSLSFIDRYQ